MTPDQWLKEVKERCEKAIKGPWTIYPPQHDHDYITVRSKFDEVCAVTINGLPELDAEFIASARQDLPRAIRLIEKYRTVLQEMAVDKYDGNAEGFYGTKAQAALDYTGDE